MKLYAPRYYKDFICIADKCDHSCCIGWEIDIDKGTFEKYKGLKGGYGAEIINSISTEGTPHFVLCGGDRCPHLDERGLCKIILTVGEGYLCDICREHPRFYNYTQVAEVGLGMSCREAARIILSSPDYDTYDEIGELNAAEDEPPYDGRNEREKIYEILRDRTTGYKTRLEAVYRAYGIDAGDDREWLEAIDSLEYLDPTHKKLFMKYSSDTRPVGKDEYLERALAYFVYRHCTEAYDEEDLYARLALCLFLERLLASLICSEGAETLKEVAALASIISEEIEYSEDNTEALTYRF
ncbi:MAG: flagellin lysine-N-methylase [Clostridia bacterium]|nr:flagellin lysine-N-methylase [Clostridia bacterium]